MKHTLLALYALTVLSLDVSMCYAQDAATAVQAQVAASVAPAPAPQVSIQAAVAKAPEAVVVPEPAAPPQWASEVLLSVSKLPVIGPYASKFLLYLGILAALLTTLMGAALSIIATLKTGFTWAGLDTAANAIANFRNGKIMYWLLYFSNFNAKKKVA